MLFIILNSPKPLYWVHLLVSVYKCYGSNDFEPQSSVERTPFFDSDLCEIPGNQALHVPWLLKTLEAAPSLPCSYCFTGCLQQAAQQHRGLMFSVVKSPAEELPLSDAQPL